MNITIYNNFAKRKNSTKRPSSGTIVQCKLKEETSIESPSFILRMRDDFESINYVYAMGHYYFVDDTVILDDNRFMLQCSQDVLATYRQQIYGLNVFVERSATVLNPNIPDPYVTIHDKEFINESVVSVGDFFNETGFYIISVLNDIGSGAGFTTYYLLSASQLQDIANYCNSNIASTTTTVLEWLQATFLKTADAIIDCKWMPLSIQILGGLSGLVADPVKIGNDTLGVRGYRFTNTVIASKTYTVRVVHHYDDFRIAQPYTKAFLYIPFYGMYQFNPLDFVDTIKIKFDIDMATGDVTCYLSNKDDNLISIVNYNVGVTAPVGKVGNQAGNVLTSTLATVGGVIGAVSTGGVGGVVAGISATATGINALSNVGAISPSVKGSMAGRSMSKNGLDLRAITIASETSDPSDFLNIIGQPLRETTTLSSLRGYVQTSNASISIAGRTTDTDTINSMLDSGIFLE